ncbi:MAG: hypothetical protein KAS49_01415, partial [Candidatus Cloacimonetes bacterium]|nr:hypothetical protein [Candidatus Cloacimonadota bacterium]
MKKILIGSLLLLCVILFAEESRSYRLINADVGTATEIDGERVMTLIGNVHFFYGETEFFSNTAELYDTKKITKLSGDVRIIEDSLSLCADNVTYLRLSEKLHFSGDVLIREDHADSTFRTFAADSVNYYRQIGELEAHNNVTVFDERESINGNCGFLKYDINDGYGYLLKRPEMCMQDSIKISAEKIEYFKEFSKIAANFDVITESPDFKITSDFLLYFDIEQKAIFLGQPKFISEYADAVADEIRIHFEEQKIQKAELENNCKVEFSDEPNEKRESWISSGQMQFYFSDGTIKVCDAMEEVRS